MIESAARVGRTLLSDAFDLVVAFDSGSETKLNRTTEACSNVEERRFKRRVGRPKKSTRLQPPRGRPTKKRLVISNRAESPVRNLLSLSPS
jgi:hypothetical protein